MDKEKLYIIYSRKSKFTGKGESIENQIEMCKNTLLNKYENIEKNIVIFQDEGFTGYNTNRPEFQKMMKLIRTKKVECVIVYRLDRISRNVSDFCNLRDEFEKYHVAFISVTENFDTSTPMGAAMLMISSVFAQLERDTIAERIRDNMYELAKTGRWLGGTTPLGYKSKKNELIDLYGKKRYLYSLEIIDEEAEKIKLIWNKLDELKGLSKLESYLLNQGIKTRNNNNFTRFSLTTILKNPVYVIADQNIKDFFESKGAEVYAEDNDFNGKNGLIAYNKRLENTGKTKSMKDISEWIIAVGKHNGIINSNKFIETWKLLENNQNKRFRTPPENNSILSGIIRCKHCGSFMRPRLRNTYNNGKRNFSYLCELKDKSRKKLCSCKNVNGIEIDKLIIAEINNLKLPINNLILKLTEITNNNQKQTIKKQNEIQELMKNITKNKIKIQNLIEKLSIIDKDIIEEFTTEIKKLKDKNIEIEKKINKLKSEENPKIDSNTNTKLAIEVLNNYLHSFDSIDLVTKRLMIKSLIASIEIDENTVYINYIDHFSKTKCPRCNSSRSSP